MTDVLVALAVAATSAHADRVAVTPTDSGSAVVVVLSEVPERTYQAMMAEVFGQTGKSAMAVERTDQAQHFPYN